MTCESTASVCGCVWLSQEPMSWCSRQEPPPLSFMSPWSLWVGYEIVSQTICCLSCVICPHLHPITTGSGSSSLLTDQNTDPQYHRQILIQSAWKAHTIVVYALSFNRPWQKYRYTVGPAPHLAPPSFHVSNDLILVVYILSHNLLVQISLKWHCGVEKELKKEPQMVRNCWNKYSWLKIRKRHIYVVCC